MASIVNNGGAELLASFAATNPALHTHLTNLITHLIQHQPPNPFQHIEQLSAQLAHKHSTPPSAVTPSVPASLTAYLNETPYIFSKRPPPAPVVNADGEEVPVEEEEDTPIPAILPNIASLASLLHEAGVSLSADEALLLDKAMIALLKGRDGVESVRYWGRLHTTGPLDYYVYEVKKAGYDEDEERDRVARERAVAETGLDVAEGRELYGSGTNEYVYFVTQSIDTPSPTFTQLPAALPRYIADSRRSRRFLTGSLLAAVGGFPPFVGTEADLLRSVIARVSSGSVVVPKGSWREEEGDVVIEDDTWKGIVRGETVGWAHVRGKLRRDGRVEPLEEEADGEEEESEEKKAAKAAAFEAKAPLLSATSTVHFSYRASTALDTAQLPPPPPAADSDELVPPTATSHVTHSAHSLAWPGSVSVVRGREYGSVYIGWGQRQAVGGEAAWTVGSVSAMEREWAGSELVEQAEVVATEEEEKKEREEEDERKKEEGEKKEEEEADELPDDEEEKPEDE